MMLQKQLENKQKYYTVTHNYADVSHSDISQQIILIARLSIHQPLCSKSPIAPMKILSISKQDLPMYLSGSMLTPEYISLNSKKEFMTIYRETIENFLLHKRKKITAAVKSFSELLSHYIRAY